MKKYLLTLMVGISLLWVSCYTTLQHPDVAADAEIPSESSDEQADASCLSCHRNGLHSSASIPAGRRDNFSWNYYYNSAWWQDTYRMHGADGSALAPTPSDFRQRYPNYDGGSGVGTGSVSSPTYGTPSLGKKPGDSEPADQGAAQKKDPRRDFDRRNETKKTEEESRNQVERQPKR